MNKKNLTIIISSLACILSVVAIILVLNTNHFSFTNNTKSNDSLEKDTSKNDINDNNDNKIDDTETDANIDNKTDNNKTTSNSKSETQKDPTYIPNKSENDVVSYFQNLSNSITNRNNENDTALREKIKTGFVTVVDFIFYDGEIKGYKFSELTDTAKLKILELATAIDSEIDEYFPNYKDTIKNGYTNLKVKLAAKYLEYTNKLCETVGEETCNEAKEDFNKLKENFGIAWDAIKGALGNGVSKLSEFYLNWKDK